LLRFPKKISTSRLYFCIVWDISIWNYTYIISFCKSITSDISGWFSFDNWVFLTLLLIRLYFKIRSSLTVLSLSKKAFCVRSQTPVRVLTVSSSSSLLYLVGINAFWDLWGILKPLPSRHVFFELVLLLTKLFFISFFTLFSEICLQFLALILKFVLYGCVIANSIISF
jgi:hypothetical protein